MAMDGQAFIEDLFLNEGSSDVTVRVERFGHSWAFPCHSFILRTRSPVFQAMFESDFCESKDREVVITDFSGVNVKQFLRYLYTMAVPEAMADVLEVLKIADKYQVLNFMTACEKQIIRDLRLSDVLYIFEAANRYSLRDIETLCFNLICRTAFKTLQSERIECLPKELMIRIVSSDALNIEDESEVYSAIERWLKNLPCERSNEYFHANGDLLQCIRWNVMDETKRACIISSTAYPPNDEDLARQNKLRQSLVLPKITSFCEVLSFDSGDRTSHSYKRNSTFACMTLVTTQKCPIYFVGAEVVLSVPIHSNSDAIEITDLKLFAVNVTTGVKQMATSTVAKKSLVVQLEFPKPVVLRKGEEVQFYLHIEQQCTGSQYVSKFDARKKLFTMLSGKELMLCGESVTAIGKLFIL